MPVGGQHGAGWAGRGVKCILYPSTNIPYQAPVGVCTRSTAPAPRGAFGRVMALSKPAPFLPPFQPPPSPFSTPRCSMGLYIHQTSACALKRSNTDLAQPSWLGPEVNLPPRIIPNGTDCLGGSHLDHPRSCLHRAGPSLSCPLLILDPVFSSATTSLGMRAAPARCHSCPGPFLAQFWGAKHQVC